MNPQEVLDRAVEIAREAGQLLREGFHSAKRIERKATSVDLVTQYDTQAEALITDRLRESFPDHRLLAEEGGGTHDDDALTWHIDPLDGTTNFAHGYPQFCVSMALVDGEGPLLGVVYDPMRDEQFTASRGRGAHLLSGDGSASPLSVSRVDSLGESLLATGFPYDRWTNPQNNLQQFGAFLRQVQGMRRVGSAALDLCSVAAGRLDGFWEFRLSSWDVAAGVLIISEAGGRVTAIDGAPLDMCHSPVSLIASNGLLQQAMVDVLRAVDDSASV
jgi:myo-inositol-1(or 4)-monophosphatase